MAFTVSARLAATKAVIKEEMFWKSWAVWFFVLMEVGSLGAFLQIGYFIHPGLLFVPALLQVSLSASRVTSRRDIVHDLRQQVYFALFCEGFSAFGLGRKQKGATCFYAVTAVLRAGCLALVVLLLTDGSLCGHVYTTPINVHYEDYEAHDVCCSTIKSFCDYYFNFKLKEVPGMLKLACSHEDFSWFEFQSCVHGARTQILENVCNARASSCRLPRLWRSPEDFAFYCYVMLPFLSFLEWFIVILLSSAYFRSCFLLNAKEDRDLRKAVRRRSKTLEREMFQHKPTLKKRAEAYFAFAIFLFDVASDFSCLAQFILTGQPGFAAAQAVIVVVSAATELRKGSPMDLLRAFRDFRQTGVPSDTFLSILQAEQSLEAPLSFFLQYYSAFFTSGSRLAFLNLCFSICMSLYGISKGVYENLHLNLEDAYNAAEELAAMDTTSEPSTPQAQHLAQVVGLPQPPGMGPLSQPPAVPLPPPPGMGPPPSQMAAVPLPPHPKLPPGMAAAVVQPPPPVGPVQLGGHVKDTE